MTTVAQGINKKTVFAKQSALGTPATSGGQIMRRTSSVFNETRDVYNNNEIVSHQQSTGDNAGVRRTTGRLDGLLSAGTYAGLFASLLRKDLAATSAITSLSITIAGAGPTYTVTRATGDFLTGGIKIGDVVRLTAGSFTAANLNANLLVIGVTATVLTVLPLNSGALVAEGPIASATVTVPGKKTWAPSASHTNDYYTVEEVYSDLARYEQYNDTKIAQAEVAIPATGNGTVSFTVPGLSRTRSGSATIAAPTTETTSNVLTAVNGLIVVNGVVTPITGGSLTINDIPLADITRDKHEHSFAMRGIGYEWNLEEINLARMLGQNLPADKAAGARRIAESFLYNLAMTGDTTKGWTGLLNDAAVTAADVAADGESSSKYWTAKTPAQIVRDINEVLVGIHVDTNEVEMADTLILPTEQMLYLASTQMSAGSDTTLLAFIRANNAYTATTGQELMIRGSRSLATAGTGGVARGVAYWRNPEAVRFHMPMPFRFLPPWQKSSMAWEVAGIMRTGGVEIRLPGAVRYFDEFAPAPA